MTFSWMMGVFVFALLLGQVTLFKTQHANENTLKRFLKEKTKCMFNRNEKRHSDSRYCFQRKPKQGGVPAQNGRRTHCLQQNAGLSQ